MFYNTDDEVFALKVNREGSSEEDTTSNCILALNLRDEKLEIRGFYVKFFTNLQIRRISMFD